MKRCARLTLMALLLAGTARADALVGTWTCLTPLGEPAFAFAITAPGGYADPSGAVGVLAQPEVGVVRFVTGNWAGSVGAWTPQGQMALMLPGSDVPVLCRAGD